MSSTTTEKKSIDILDELKRLDFISIFFSWMFMLLSRLAEPLMLLSAIYIIIEAGIPQATNGALHNASVGAMITAPEIILPGAFVLAAKAKREGKSSRMMFTTCIFFVILTLTTLLSLFVFHFAQDVINVIMFLRCATGIGYSILIRIHTYSGQSIAQTPPVPQPAQVIQPELTPAHISFIVEQLKNHVGEVAAVSVKTYLDTLPVPTPQTTVSTTLETGTVKPSNTVKRSMRTTSKNRRVQRGAITSIARKLVTDDEVKHAYADLLQESQNGRVTADSLKDRAGIGKPRACQWLRENTNQAEQRTA